ncbi:TlpA family protein disulfide reductase [Rhodococcus sp. MEB064]|uniref:TlpA family protein disulfide reductase n=1 Tax=Rhodococcus sp. MEB064 TaxID=1587522 RepID=UPI0005ACC1FA|nr:thioredoxin family protein [Rhodococcus sp. MEB064]KIQ18895.1 thioredoxin [Rhodococcus sp. MEB064]
MTAVLVLVVALVLAGVVGLWLRRREGAVRSTEPGTASASRADALRAVGVRDGAVTVLHFSATWCGPCAAVRRVVASVVSDLDSPGRSVSDVEVDMDEQPQLAREFGVMSLPTTFVLDPSMRERSRASGVPSVADLRTAILAASGPTTS